MNIYFLYIKHCSHCSLQYLGQTKQDPFKYKGSGKRWQQHIKKHKAYIHTEVIGIYNDKKLLSEAGIFFSKLYNVVEDAGWANLKEESGDGGFKPGIHNDTWKKKHALKMSEPEYRAKRSTIARVLSQNPEYRAKLSLSQIKRWADPKQRREASNRQKGKPRNPELIMKRAAAMRAIALKPERRAKLSTLAKKRWEDPEFKAKMNKINKESYHARVPRVCSHCGLSSKNYSKLAQHHFDKCKKKRPSPSDR